MSRQRKNFIRQHYDREISDPSCYDLVVNTGHIPVTAAADIVAAAYKVKFPEPRPVQVELPDRGHDSFPFQPPD